MDEQNWRINSPSGDGYSQQRYRGRGGRHNQSYGYNSPNNYSPRNNGTPWHRPRVQSPYRYPNYGPSHSPYTSTPINQNQYHYQQRGGRGRQHFMDSSQNSIDRWTSSQMWEDPWKEILGAANDHESQSTSSSSVNVTKFADTNFDDSDFNASTEQNTNSTPTDLNSKSESFVNVSTLSTSQVNTDSDLSTNVSCTKIDQSDNDNINISDETDEAKLSNNDEHQVSGDQDDHAFSERESNSAATD